jgi:hypothetical protein
MRSWPLGDGCLSLNRELITLLGGAAPHLACAATDNTGDGVPQRPVADAFAESSGRIRLFAQYEEEAAVDTVDLVVAREL